MLVWNNAKVLLRVIIVLQASGYLALIMKRKASFCRRGLCSMDWKSSLVYNLTKKLRLP